MVPPSAGSRCGYLLAENPRYLHSCQVGRLGNADCSPLALQILSPGKEMCLEEGQSTTHSRMGPDTRHLLPESRINYDRLQRVGTGKWMKMKEGSLCITILQMSPRLSGLKQWTLLDQISLCQDAGAGKHAVLVKDSEKASVKLSTGAEVSSEGSTLPTCLLSSRPLLLTSSWLETSVPHHVDLSTDCLSVLMTGHPAPQSKQSRGMNTWWNLSLFVT